MENIKHLRKKKRMHQSELASICGVSQSAVSAWERGTFEPDISSLIKIADYFNVSTDYLVGRTSQPSYYVLNDIEKNVLSIFNSLNHSGKDVALDMLSAISFNSKYINDKLAKPG